MGEGQSGRAVYCWKCRSYFPPGTRICVNCGVDLETGERVEQARGVGEEESPAPALRYRLLMFVNDWMPGLLRPGIVVLSLVTALAGCAVMFFFLVMFPTVLLAKVAFAGAGLVLYAHAIGFMMAGRVCTLAEALGELSGGQWALFFTILLVPQTVIVGLAVLAAGAR